MRDCATTQQWQTPTTNNPASGTGTSTHSNTHYTSSQSNTQSPVSQQHSQSTLHIQTPTLNINAPHFQSKLQQPPPPCTQNNQNINHPNNQQQIHTPLTQPFNVNLPSFNTLFPTISTY